MIEYLKKYQRLLELLETNKKQTEENQKLIDDNYKKWFDTKEKKSNIDLQIKELYKKYNDAIEKKEKNFFSMLSIILTLASIIIIILSSIFINPIILLLGIPLATAISSIIYLSFFLIKICSYILDKQFHKDKNVSNLLEQIENKEKELSVIKKICEEYSQKLIEYQSKAQQLKKKRTWIIDSINELMRDYATPIFNEQLKNIEEEQFDAPHKKTKKKEQKTNH